MMKFLIIQPLDAWASANEWIGYMVTALASGSLSWITTVKWTRQQAKSDAMKSVQDVYQELVEDLKRDRDLQREENERLVAKLKANALMTWRQNATRTDRDTLNKKRGYGH